VDVGNRLADAPSTRHPLQHQRPATVAVRGRVWKRGFFRRPAGRRNLPILTVTRSPCAVAAVFSGPLHLGRRGVTSGGKAVLAPGDGVTMTFW
jgi:hypothetical protein